MIKILIALLIGCGLAGCQTTNNYEIYKGKAFYIEGTSTKDRLIALPDLDNQPKITIAVYRFLDQNRSKKT